MVDKHNLIDKISTLKNVKLELGCGGNKKLADAIAIDLIDYKDVDIVGDVFEVLAKIPNESVDVIFSSHFIEHLSNIKELIVESARVLKPKGSFIAMAPHFSNPWFYSDYTHNKSFGLYSMSYFAHDNILRRKVPVYDDIKFNLVDVRLEFKSERPFYVRHVLKKMLGKLININKYMMEFYEENVSNILSCYEIIYYLEKV